MKNIVLKKNQIKKLYESLEGDRPSNKLAPFIFKQVKNHMTSLGDNEAFPPEEDFPFDYKVLKSRFNEVIERISKIGDLESYDEKYLANRLSKDVRECKELEEAIRPNLEKICTNAVLKLFDVPNDTVDFEAKLVDEVEPEHQFRIKPEPSSKRNFDFDDLNDFGNANKTVLKRRMINALIQGAAYTYSQDTDLYLAEVYKIDKHLIDLYGEISAINDYLLFVKEEKITDKHPMQGGCVEVMLGDTFKDKCSIKAQGIIFPFLLHELIRGFMELFASHSLPDDDAKARYVINQADFLIAEPWDLRMGVGLWNYIAKDMPNTQILPYFFDNLCCLDTKEFNDVLREVFAETKKGKHILSHMFNNAEEDMEGQGFISKIDLKNSQISVIADEVEMDDNMTEALDYNADKSIFDTRRGKELSQAMTYDEVDRLLHPALGELVGRGSSRIVYDIDDYQVMKVAYGKEGDDSAGIAQNMLEKKILTSKRFKNYSIFPKFLYGDERGKWIVVEKVIPATEEDFIKILHMNFKYSKTDLSGNYDDYYEYTTDEYGDKISKERLNARENLVTFCSMIEWAYKIGSRKSKYDSLDLSQLEWVKKNRTLYEFFKLVSSHQLCGGDLTCIENLGIVMRNGKPQIVVLDAGLNKDVYLSYYDESFQRCKKMITEEEDDDDNEDYLEKVLVNADSREIEFEGSAETIGNLRYLTIYVHNLPIIIDGLFFACEDKSNISPNTYQLHISVPKHLQKKGIAYKLYRCFLEKVGDIVSLDRNRVSSYAKENDSVEDVDSAIDKVLLKVKDTVPNAQIDELSSEDGEKLGLLMYLKESVNENQETEAVYDLNPNERGNKVFDYQDDMDWKSLDSKDMELLNFIGQNWDDKNRVNTQDALVDKDASMFSKYGKYPMRDEIIKRLQDRFGKVQLTPEDLGAAGFDINLLRSQDKRKKGKETDTMKDLKKDFDVTAIGKSFARGNAKLSADILIVNLTTALNCPSANKNLCAVADICYARAQERQYPNVIKNNLRNEIIMPMLSMDEFVKYIEDYIKNSRFKANYIRFNEAGDFPNQAMVDRCDKAAEYFYKEYGIISSAYTCRNDLDFTKCKYLIINASNTKVEGLDRVYLAVPKAVFDKIPDSKDGGVVEFNGEPSYKCICNCRQCHFCYQTRGQNGETEGIPTKIYCMYHKDAEDEQERIKNERRVAAGLEPIKKGGRKKKTDKK